MITRIKNDFHSYMLRPMLYKCVTKLSLGLVLCLLWDRFINFDHARSMVGQAFFVAGAFFLILAWFSYLRLDGMKIHHLFEDRKKKKKPRKHWKADIIDFADEKIISFEELEEEEKILCQFLGDLLCAVIFLVPSVISNLL